MAVKASRIAVADAPVRLNTGGDSGGRPGKKVRVRNSGANPADLGGADLGALGTGYALAANATEEFELEDGEVLFAVAGAAAASTTLQVIVLGG